MKFLLNIFIISILITALGCKKEIIIKKEIDLLSILDSSEIDENGKEYVHPSSSEIEDERRWGIFEHAPSQIHFNDIYIGKNAYITFGIGIEGLKNVTDTDGVQFDIDIKQKGNETNTIFTRTIDPLKNKNDRIWNNEKVFLNNITDSTVTVVLRTTPGKKRNIDFDRAVWAQPKILSDGIIKKIKNNNKKTNVIIITLDTVRADYLHCYGNPWIKTEKIDYLARNGAIFNKAYSASSTTNPSHISLFSSLSTYSHGILSNDYTLSKNVPVLAKIFKKNQYKTGAVTSVFHMNRLSSGLSSGFDSYKDINMNWMNMRITDIYTLTRNADTTTANAVEFLENNAENPFFLWVHYYDPHFPYQAVGKYHKMYYPGDPTSSYIDSMKNALFQWTWTEDNLKWIRPFKDLDYFKKEYAGEISYTDEFVGKLLDTLKRLKCDDNTLILIAADHGESFGDHEVYFDHWSLYDSDIHVPLILWYPGKIKKGTQINDQCSLLDVTPTIMDLIGIQDTKMQEYYFEGHSLVKTINNPALQDKDRIIVSEGLLYLQIAGFDSRCKVIWELSHFKYHDKMQILPDRVWLFDREKDSKDMNPAAGFYWGDRVNKSDPWSKLRNEPPRDIDGVTMESIFRDIKNNALTKLVPSMDELKNKLSSNDTIDFIRADYADDNDFLERAIRIMHVLKDELNPVPLAERIEKLDPYWKEDSGQYNSKKNEDEIFLRGLNSLGYTAK